MGPRMLCSLGCPGSPSGRETVQPDAITNWWRPGISSTLDMDGDTPEVPNNVWVQLDSTWVPWVDPVLSHRQGAKSIFFTSQIFHHSQLQVSLVCSVSQFGMCVPRPLFLASMTLPRLTGPPASLAVSSQSPLGPPFPLSITPLCGVLYPVPHLLHQELITQDRHGLWESRCPNWMLSLLFPPKMGSFSCIYSNTANSSMITPHCPCQGPESHLVPEHLGMTAQAILLLPFTYCKPGICKTLTHGASWFLPSVLKHQSY